MSQEQAIRLSNTLASQPWPINASSWQGGQEGDLHLRLNGAKAAVQSAISAFKEYGMQTVNEAAAAMHWQGLREQSHPWFNPALKLWRFALPPTTAPLALEQDCLVEWHGGQRWVQGELDYAHWSQKARELGGHVSLFRGADRSSQLRASLQDNPKTQALHLIEDRLRKTFDPDGVFATGRMN
jgi:glycolate oxidase FAD binding subunit